MTNGTLRVWFQFLRDFTEAVDGSLEFTCKECGHCERRIVDDRKIASQVCDVAIDDRSGCGGSMVVSEVTR